MVYLLHDAPPDVRRSLAERTTTLAMAEWRGGFDNHATLSAVCALADPYAPDWVLTWDEDELPPEEVTRDYLAALPSEVATLMFRCVWCVGDLDHVLADPPHRFYYHDKVIRWSPSLSAMGFKECNRARCWPNNQRRRMEVRYRHLAVMTPEDRATYHRRNWWKEGLQVIPWRT